MQILFANSKYYQETGSESFSVTIFAVVVFSSISLHECMNVEVCISPFSQVMNQRTSSIVF